MFTAACLLLLPAATALDLYVSPTGSDSTGTGSPSSPWASPFPALSTISSSKSNGVLPSTVTVHFASGTYFLPTTLSINASTGGDTSGHSVIFAGPEDPTLPPAILSGGTLMPTWAAMPGFPGVYTAPLPPSTPTMVRQMWDAASGKRMLLATLPMTTVAVGQAGQWGVKFPPGYLSQSDIPTLAEAELVLYHNWVNSQNKIAAVNLTNSSITVRGEAGDPFFGAGGDTRFTLQNVAQPGRLAPGTFYCSQGAMVFMPPTGAPPPSPTSPYIVEGLPTVLSLAGTPTAPVSSFILTNLTLAHAAADLEGTCMSGGCGGQSVSESTIAAFHATYAVGCGLEGVEIGHVGAYGGWWDVGSSGCWSVGCWVHDSGMGGFRVGNGDNAGSPGGEPTRGVSITDSVMEDGGHVCPAGTGILSQEAYATVISHNHIHHYFYTGVGTGWTWGYAADGDGNTTVSFNHIHDIFQGVLSDGGCIYNLGRSPGTDIDNNLCHDVVSYGYGGWGLYTDEGSSNVTLRNNVVYDTKDAGFHQHYGTDNLLINNIFAFPSSKYCINVDSQCDNSAIRSSQHMDCGLWEGGDSSSSSSSSSSATPDYGCNSSFTFTRNIILLGTQDVSGNATTHMHLTFVAYRHPEVNGLRNMTWGDNVYWSAPLGGGSLEDLRFGTDFPPLNFSAWQTTFHDATSVVADPKFVDAQAKNFALLPDSPALAMGFQPIDLSTIGPRFPLRWKGVQ